MWQSENVNTKELVGPAHGAARFNSNPKQQISQPRSWATDYLTAEVRGARGRQQQSIRHSLQLSPKGPKTNVSQIAPCGRDARYRKPRPDLSPLSKPQDYAVRRDQCKALLKDPEQ